MKERHASSLLAGVKGMVHERPETGFQVIQIHLSVLE